MTTDSRKIQLEVGVDATDAKTGFQQVKDSAKDMAQSVKKSGDDAAKGLDGIGDGLSKSTEKFTRDEGRLRAAIQRSTLELQNLGKTASQKFEAKVDFLGFDQGRFAPYIAEMKAAEAEQKKLATGFQALGIRSNSGIVDEAQKIRAAFSQIKAGGIAEEIERARAVVATKMAALRSEFDATAANANTNSKKIGVSAAQTAAALRGVPAQFTDIVTSLQGGQAPLTVLLQQGGQLKDMFGGIGPAAKALGGYVAGLVNPFTLAAGAAAGLGYAFYEATERTQEFNKALITTGNYVGKSAGDLNAMAKSISNTIGTQGQAADALTALASSGKITGDQLQLTATAVVAANKAMGTSVEEAVAQYVKLGEEPTKASAKLNESLHYLNLATYERIRALEDQGHKEEAAALAQSTYATATVDRMQQVINQSGLMSKALSGTKDVALGMWNAVSGALGSIGAQQAAAEKLIDAQRKVSFLQQNGSTPEALAAAQGDVAGLSRQALRQQETAEAEGIRATFAQQGMVASDAVAKWQQQAKGIDAVNRELKKYRDQIETIRRENPKSDALDPAKIAAGEEAIRKSFQGDKAPKAKAYQDDAATRMLESLRQQEASLKEQLSTDQKLTEAEKERAKFTQLVGDLKTKGTLTADQKSLLLSQDAIKAQLDQNVAISKEIELKKDAAKLDEQKVAFAKQLQGITLSYESANESRSEQYDRVLSTVGLGTRARQEVEAQKTIRKEYDRYVLQANRDAAQASADAAKNGLTFDAFASDDYKKKIVELDAARESEILKQKEFFARDKADRENWVNGAREAFANYSDYASNAAAHTEEVFGNALKGLEDQFTNLLTGKKFDAKKLLADTGADLARNAVREGITGPLAKFGGDLLGDGGALAGLLGSTSKKEAFAGRGSSASNPLYVRSADSFGTAANASSFGSSSSSGSGIASAIGSIFGGLSNGTATSVANALPGDSLDNLIKLTGGWGTIAGFAGGGSPPLNRVSIVGERGPELFVPRQAGTIVPNHALGGGQRDRPTIQNNITVQGHVDRRTADQIAMKAGQMTTHAMRRMG